MGVPGAAERADILQKQLSSVPCSATTDELVQLADAAHGYVGADIAAICKEAGKSSPSHCPERQNVLAVKKITTCVVWNVQLMSVQTIRECVRSDNRDIKLCSSV